MGTHYINYGVCRMIKVFITSFKLLTRPKLIYCLICRNVHDSLLSHILLQIQNISTGFRDMSHSVNFRFANMSSDSPATAIGHLI